MIFKEICFKVNKFYICKIKQQEIKNNQKVWDNQNQLQNQKKIIKKDFWLYTHIIKKWVYLTFFIVKHVGLEQTVNKNPPGILVDFYFFVLFIFMRLARILLRWL